MSATTPHSAPGISGTETVPTKTWLAVFGAALGAFIAILNIQIIASCLANVEGGIGAGADEGNWITTSYLVAEIIVIPMSGWLARMLSLRTYILSSALLFVVFTVACSFARTLDQMVVLRVLQGFTGGGLIPLSFSIVMTTLPRSKQPIGVALFALAAVMAPSLGPAVGGFFSDLLGWRSIFFVSLPPGLVTFAILWYAVPKTSPQWRLMAEADWWGMLTMAVGLGALQVALEEGNRQDWFGSPFIVRLTVLAALCLVAFVMIELKRKEPLLQLRILGRRNFGFASAANLLFGFTVYGWLLTLPTYLARVQGYSAAEIGEVMLWLGPPQLLLIGVMPRIVRKFDPRILVGFGFLLYICGTLTSIHLSSDFSGPQFLVSDIIRAFAQVMVMTPLSSIAVGDVERQHAGSAAALFNMMRNLGGAIGIAVLETFTDRREHFHSQILTSSVSDLSVSSIQRIADLTEWFAAHGDSDPAGAQHQALIAVGRSVHQQALFMAYGDAIYLQGALMVIALVIVFMLRRPVH
ncbi:DHA2 family efflux MFS transporter permease subunit [Paraburkholderia sp. 22B1P]|uniref:DHA2 family efflux MFS transporter permease subunit n=1 Tax=Paraburkholderia sp. 22B1P TaxID=3080498 RepID=UPI00308BEAB5|nr:DHA2 family efflux MFS transporter permease subunit [Paraburkholderia sp. 22B1P]